MLYRVVIRDQVHDDIDDFSEYVFGMTLSQTSAQKVYDTLYKNIFSLNFMPNRFEKYIGEYRRIVIDRKYKILYKVDEELKKVIIIRVIRTETEYVDY